MQRDLKYLRDRCVHSVNPDVAAACGLSLGELQQFGAGFYRANEDQLFRLNRYFGFA